MWAALWAALLAGPLEATDDWLAVRTVPSLAEKWAERRALQTAELREHSKADW